MSTSVAHIIRRRRARRARRREQRAANRSRLSALIAFLAVIVIIPAGVVFGGAALQYTAAVEGLPDPQQTIYLDPIIGPTRLYDRSGTTLLVSVQDPLGDQREWIMLDTLPEAMIYATLLMEDPDFLQSNGFDMFGTIARLWFNILDGPLPTDDTSLTGRLVHNVIAPLPEVITREYRTREIALIAEINRRYDKMAIIEWHLNTNYYGNEAYGIEAAARIYFGKSAHELTVDEAALLATIPPAPQFNPWDNEVAARGRQGVLLAQLLEQGYITAEQYAVASSTVTAVRRDSTQIAQIAPEFATYARRQAESILDALGLEGAQLVARGGLQITTTLDLDLYYQAQCALNTHLARLNATAEPDTAQNGQPCIAAAYLPPAVPAGELPPDTGALVIVDVATGEIRALVGAGDAPIYQPGLTLHPFVYLEGFLTTQYTPATMVLDIPRQFPGAIEGLIYPPQNPDGQFRGPISLRDAMAAGLLPPTVEIANARGLSQMFVPARRMGVISLREDIYDLSLLERGGAVSVLEMVYAYSVFASQGDMRGLLVPPIAPGYRRHDPVAVLRITENDGTVLWEYGAQRDLSCVEAVNCTNVLQSSPAYLVNNILADTAARVGTLGDVAAVLGLSRPAALVNGLTGSRQDAWTIGYTPQLVTGVRLGREDASPMTLDAWGINGAAPVWTAVMEYAHARDALPVLEWTRPDDVITVQVCERSGLLPNGICPSRDEIFVNLAVPAAQDTFWRAVEVNADTGQLATVNTPATSRATRIFFVPPGDALDWWQANNLPLPPTQYDSVSAPPALGGAAIVQPEAFTYVSGVVEIRGTIDATDMQYYQLAYGQGLGDPDAWIAIGGQVTTYDPSQPLGTWDTTGLDGIYNLRLQVVMRDNSVRTSSVQVTVDNRAPNVTLAARGVQTGTEGLLFIFPADQALELSATAVDNLAVDRVEFYHNGQLLGVDRTAPYGFIWDITRTGIEEFTAVVFDVVGNIANTGITVEVRR